MRQVLANLITNGIEALGGIRRLGRAGDNSVQKGRLPL